MQQPSSAAALLVMDMQNGIVSRFAGRPEVLEPFQLAIAAARSHGIPVIFVRLAFRSGTPEIDLRNKRFSAFAGADHLGEADPFSQIHESVQPLPGEAVVTKHRVSAFAGSSLEVILRSRGIDTLVLSGIATGGVVLSTLREASDMDFGLKVLSDATLDGDPEVHRVLLEKVFPKQADVMTVSEWEQSLRQ
ncbi:MULTISPECIES: isochorismatase family cysteine hydrolase [unclassified Paenibacillus]|uniref:cysteine hydrolase family protein n=1 Tax=unclassified Paenibacillus TaxID=185978 RepID=UPI000956DB0B|nr:MULTISPECIES: isochorismatase family cysteine hydrolase [unclassified Paenibacillus]ASS64812.1 cysteine hydrolase [Paenibacillus sp. RUD330]SIR05186.1 Nicotinamidase-related amidase [Paenibacillus sp. RU4X]SIR30175.1 Nicotinamidase-related amidase [Paenibacillus sp. RU4T]